MRPSVQHVLAGLTGAAAFVHNARLDNLAANHLGFALYYDMFSRAAGSGPVNSASRLPRPAPATFYLDWAGIAMWQAPRIRRLRKTSTRTRAVAEPRAEG